MCSPRIKLKALAGLCRRLATALEAGIDIRKVWSREANAARGSARQVYSQISMAVDTGSSLGEAVGATGTYFPVLFKELVVVGEVSGHQAEVFKQLAENYEYQVVMRRQFLGAIAWPLIQLGLALSIVGFLIWVMGFIGQMTGNKPIDLLGLGLLGNEGLAIYLAILAAIGVAAYLLFQALRRGVFWTRPLQLFVMRLPKLGRALEILALARFAWSLHITLEAGMPLERALKLALASTHHVTYTSQAEDIWLSIRGGDDLSTALERPGIFPLDFLDTVQVGEQSGKLSESLGLLSRQYQEEARSALAVLTHLAGFAVWCLVAGLIIAIIFRMFSFYLGALHDAAKGL